MSRPGAPYVHSPELIATWMRLWRSGASCGEIAKKYGKQKNVVVGVVHRNKEKGERSTQYREVVSAPQGKGRSSTTRKRVKTAGSKGPPEASGHPRTFSGLRHKACQWISGTPSADDKCKCGAALGEGRKYCPPHEVRARRASAVKTGGTDGYAARSHTHLV